MYSSPALHQDTSAEQKAVLLTPSRGEEQTYLHDHVTVISHCAYTQHSIFCLDIVHSWG